MKLNYSEIGIGLIICEGEVVLFESIWLLMVVDLYRQLLEEGPPLDSPSPAGGQGYNYDRALTCVTLS